MLTPRSPPGAASDAIRTPRIDQAGRQPGLVGPARRALGKNLITPEVRRKLAAIPLDEDHELPDLELELDRQRRVLDPTYLVCREDTPEDLKAVFQQYLEIVGV